MQQARRACSRSREHPRIRIPFLRLNRKRGSDLQKQIRRFHALLKNFDDSVQKIPGRLKRTSEKSLQEWRMTQFSLTMLAASFRFVATCMLYELVPGIGKTNHLFHED